jgi:hypothetical protein
MKGIQSKQDLSCQFPFSRLRRNPPPPSSPVSFILSRFRPSDKTADITGQSTASHFSDTSPFTTAVLGRIVLGERVRTATWIVIAVAIGRITIMVADKSGRIVLKGRDKAGSETGLRYLASLRRAVTTAKPL